MQHLILKSISAQNIQEFNSNFLLTTWYFWRMCVCGFSRRHVHPCFFSLANNGLNIFCGVHFGTAFTVHLSYHTIKPWNTFIVHLRRGLSAMYVYCISNLLPEQATPWNVFTSLDVLTFSSHHKTCVFVHLFLIVPLSTPIRHSTRAIQRKWNNDKIPFENFLTKIPFVAFRSSTKQTNKWKLRQQREETKWI